MEKHIWSSEDKLKYYGYGEWVEECDYSYFKHNGIECVVKRAVLPKKYIEKRGKLWGYGVRGGHLCGYCKLSKNHPWWEVKYTCELKINVHGGITYMRNEIIGFDAAQYKYRRIPDLIPSLMRIIKEKSKIPRKYHYVYPAVYRNMEYMREECKKLADQIIETNK